MQNAEIYCQVCSGNFSRLLFLEVYIPRDRNYAFVRFLDKRRNLGPLLRFSTFLRPDNATLILIVQVMRKMRLTEWCASHLCIRVTLKLIHAPSEQDGKDILGQEVKVTMSMQAPNLF